VPSKNPRQRLRDIVENVEAIQSFLRGLAFEDFLRDKRTIYAVTRAMEIISEASRRLPEELKQRHPELDWPAIAAAGNIYRHEYDMVDERMLWETATKGLDLLEHVAAEELSRDAE